MTLACALLVACASPPPPAPVLAPPPEPTATVAASPAPPPGPTATVAASPASPAQPPEPTATVATSPVPSAAPPVASASAAPAPPSSDPVCRGDRLDLRTVLERCTISDAAERALPPAVKAELAGPDRVKPGEEAAFELHLVNRGEAPLAFTIAWTCRSYVDATDARGAHVVEHELTDGASFGFTCSERPRFVRVELPPGGMVVEPLRWRAIEEHHRDGKLIKKGPLPAGRFTLHAHTWLMASGARSGSGSHGIYVSVGADRAVTVR